MRLRSKNFWSGFLAEKRCFLLHCFFCFWMKVMLVDLSVHQSMISQWWLSTSTHRPSDIKICCWGSLFCVYLDAYSTCVFVTRKVSPTLNFSGFPSFFYCSTFVLFFFHLYAAAAHCYISPCASLRSANLCPRTAQACVCVVIPPCRVNR